jgi:hypothetical protein
MSFSIYTILKTSYDDNGLCFCDYTFTNVSKGNCDAIFNYFGILCTIATILYVVEVVIFHKTI